MEIVEQDFKLIPVSENLPRFDLELLHIVKPRTGESRLEFKNVGYGLSLETAIKRIAHYKVYNKHKDESIKFNIYFNEYINEIKSLRNLLCN